MRQAYPSQIDSFLRAHFQGHDVNHQASALGEKVGALAAFVAFFRAMPDELIVLNENESADLYAAVEKIAYVLDTNRIGGAPPAALGSAARPLNTAWKLIQKLPDSVPSSANDLAFVTDADLRDIIGLDISAVGNALKSGEWKGATVIAASCAEALLLFGLQQRELRTPGCVAASGANITWTAKAPNYGSLEDRSWDLASYTAVAADMKLISPNTAKELEPARDYRNLIHPARAMRLRAKFDRGTAFVAVGALDHVIDDLRRNL